MRLPFLRKADLASPVEVTSPPGHVGLYLTPNGWKDREEELREAARVAHLEAEARFRDEERNAVPLDGFTRWTARTGLRLTASGWRDVELDQRERERVRREEEAAANREEMRHGPATDGFTHRLSDYGPAANLP